MFSSIRKRKICFSVDAYLKILRTKNNKRKKIILSETRKKENSFQRVGKKYPKIGKNKSKGFSQKTINQLNSNNNNKKTLRLINNCCMRKMWCCLKYCCGANSIQSMKTNENRIKSGNCFIHSYSMFMFRMMK